jgi:hypothetical protein
VVTSAILPGQQPVWDLFEAEHYQSPPQQDAGRRLLATIPDDASVVAQSPLLPHLSQRHELHLLDADAPDADYVIASEHVGTWPLATHHEVRGLLDERLRRGYRVTFNEGGWIAVAHPGASPNHPITQSPNAPIVH